MRWFVSRRITTRIAVGLAVLVALFLVFDLVVMPWYVDQEGTQEVPGVVGKTLEEARIMLSEAGLEPIEGETRPDSRTPAGSVVGQNPEGGAIVKKGRRIYLAVSAGEQLVNVPKLRGLSTRDARFALDRVGLRLGQIEYASSDTFFVNTVIDQAVSPGSPVSRGASVGVLVSRGRSPEAIVAPELIGKTVSEAEKILAKEGLTIGRITYQAGMNLVPNTIVDQYPRGGEPLGSTNSIDLFVVKLEGGKEEETRPEY
jgi:serine/threonine-protein kinase